MMVMATLVYFILKITSEPTQRNFNAVQNITIKQA